ncbi:hypothetical protein ACFL9U_09605 [Thermodesulfobacteriota bacterium]
MKTACPNEEKLADYVEDRLVEEDRLHIETHLSDCDRCLTEFLAAKSCVRGSDGSELESVPDHVTREAIRLAISNRPIPLKERFKRSAQRLYGKISDQFPINLWREPSLAPIRGSQEMLSESIVRLKKTFKEIDAEIEIEKTKEQVANIRVRINKGKRRTNGLRVTLERGEREISSELYNGGYVSFENIRFGHYTLTFIRDNLAIGSYHFEIKESSNG